MMDQQGGYRNLKVYQLAYSLAMEIFNETKKFPKEEKYSLTDQIRRSSRAVAVMIVEAWKKRTYPKAFVSKLSDAYTEAGETEAWLDFSLDCGYFHQDRHSYFRSPYDEVNKMLFSMMQHPERFCR